jgi:Cft2 family RNA processing exonuclease
MLPQTSSFRFGEFWLTQENFAIHIVGYMDPDSPGFKIANSNKGDEIEFGSYTQVKVNCDVRRFFFPTHSNRNELIEIVSKLNPLKVLLIHGEEEAKDWVGHQLLELDSNRKIHSTEYLEW